MDEAIEEAFVAVMKEMPTTQRTTGRAQRIRKILENLFYEGCDQGTGCR